MSNDQTIYYLGINDIRTANLVEDYIYTNYDLNYYWSNDFSQDFYIELANFGFISISSPNDDGLILLAEMQFEYSILDFKDLHISSKVKKLLNKNTFTFKVNNDFQAVLEKIESYHENSWCSGEYKKLMYDLISYKHKSIDFKLHCFEVYENGIMSACEIGYVIKNTYTSLSAYTNKNYPNHGTLQLVLLAKYLDKNNYDFWNLGHSSMEYKKKLGAKIYKRKDFLQRWTNSMNKTL